MTEIHRNYIQGRWTTGRDTVTSINPSDLSDPVGDYAQADPSDVDAALDAAGKARWTWQSTGLEQRQGVLAAIGGELMERSGELGELLSREEGKPRAEGVGEVYRAGQFFQYYAAEVLRQIGDKVDSVRPGVEIDVAREPVGTVAVISPWNFPIATASWKIAPALAFGNAVVWKPANETPAMAWALTEIISRQEIPAGLFNLVMGPGSSIGGHLAGHAGVDAVTFTGSLEVGRKVSTAAAANLTRYQLEMGSKNALVVMDDADLDIAVQCALTGAYSGTGQKCTASSRLVVHDSVHDAFVDKLREAVLDMQVDHALKPGTRVGPVVSERQLAANLEYIALAREEGCEHVCGGERLERATEGFYMAPALFINTRNDLRVNREEMFAPIACVIRAGSYEEALAISNDSEYGLVSGIVTKSLARATHFRRNAESGCVMVNLPTAGTDYHVPFGGRRNSSSGPREQGRYAVEFYTSVKTSYISAGSGL
jgi:alpha-ketoglutaric semialdehyde dehydrogenase